MVSLYIVNLKWYNFCIFTSMKRTVNIKPIFTIPKQKLWTGITLGLTYAFSLYGFLYVMREGMRVLYLEYNMPIVFNSAELSQFNLFFAFIALINGQSIMLSYCFMETPKQYMQAKQRRTTILNGQRVLNWTFLYWFFKIFIQLAITTKIFTTNIIVYPSKLFVATVLLLVLFFQTWNAIFLQFKQVYKWLLLSAVVISLLAFGFSKINFIDYKAIDNIIIKNNIYLHYNLKYPKAKWNTKIRHKNLYQEIYLVKNKANKPIVVIDNKEISYQQLDLLLKNKEYFNENYQLKIDEEIPMRAVKKLISHLDNNHKIAFVVKPFNATLADISYADNIIFYVNPISDKNTDNVIKIYSNTLDFCLVNGHLVRNEAVYTYLSKIDNFTEITYSVADTIPYIRYIKVLSVINKISGKLDKSTYLD